MPWLVKLFLQTKSQKGSSSGFECAGTIIDHYFIVTSKECCMDITIFKVLFNFERSYYYSSGDDSDDFEGFPSLAGDLCIGMSFNKSI